MALNALGGVCLPLGCDNRNLAVLANGGTTARLQVAFSRHCARHTEALGFWSPESLPSAGGCFQNREGETMKAGVDHF
jgi:hypothetical protein